MSEIDLEKYYKQFNFPASSTFLKQLKLQGIQKTKKEIDEFLANRVEQQQTTIQSNRKSTLGKIVAYRPLSMIQMDIFDLRKYARSNKGYKYILCIIDVFTRKVWTYKMLQKDNVNVQASFQNFLEKSGIQSNTPSILMSDNDSTFMNATFQSILEKNKIIHQPNIIDDHLALGLIDRFARTIKTIFTRLFLQAGNKDNWIDNIDEIVDNYNNSGHTAILNISPNEAFLKKKFKKIYDINYEKSKFNLSISDIEVNDKVRIKIKGQFRKGTEARYSDEVYTVKKVRGNTVTLNDDKIYKRQSLLIVPRNTVSNEQNVIVRVNRQNKIDRNIQQEGLDVANIVLNKKSRETLLNALDNSVEKPQVLRRSSRVQVPVAKRGPVRGSARAPAAVRPARPDVMVKQDTNNLRRSSRVPVPVRPFRPSRPVIQPGIPIVQASVDVDRLLTGRRRT
jgi:transposase InsO family protein